MAKDYIGKMAEILYKNSQNNYFPQPNIIKSHEKVIMPREKLTCKSPRCRKNVGDIFR